MLLLRMFFFCVVHVERKRIAQVQNNLVLISNFFTASDHYENDTMIQYGSSVRLTDQVPESISEGPRLLLTSSTCCLSLTPCLIVVWYQVVLSKDDMYPIIVYWS